MTRTLTRNGRTGRPLHDPGIVAPKVIVLDTPSTHVICNASSTAAYTSPAWPVRAGADDHKRFASRGM